MGRWKIDERRDFLTSKGLSPDDIHSWRRKWNDHKQNTKKKGDVSVLTFEDYINLALNAGIGLDQIGQRPEQYCLGRYKDVGIYDTENCRFITQTQNQVERRENGGLESAANKIRGRTKETHAYIAEHSERMKIINSMRKLNAS